MKTDSEMIRKRVKNECKYRQRINKRQKLLREWKEPIKQSILVFPDTLSDKIIVYKIQWMIVAVSLACKVS